MNIAENAVAKGVFPLALFASKVALKLWWVTSRNTPHFVFGGQPAKLESEHLVDARLYADRTEMLELLPKGKVAAEVGTFKGDFARTILDRVQPSSLHLFDLTFDLVPPALLRDAIDDGRLVKHTGDSATELAVMPDGFFSWLYIDGDHSLAGVKRDVMAADRTLEPGGYMMFNDYLAFDPLAAKPYGVIHAVNDLCVSRGYKVVGFALHRNGYNDILLRKPA